MIVVLHILPTLDPRSGGLSQAVKSITKYTADPLLRHEVLCLDDPAADYLENNELVVHALGKGFTSWNYHPGLLPWLLKNLPQYHRVVVHGLWQYQSFAVYRAFKKNKNTNLYVMPHGMLDPYFQQAKERRFKALRNVVFWNLIESRLINFSNGMLFTCNVEKIRARTTFSRYRPVKEVVVGLGVERPPSFVRAMTDAFESVCPQIKNRRYLLFMSRLHPKKGIDLLISSYNKLKLSEIDLPLLIIAGPGVGSEYGHKILGLAGGTEDILFPGMLTGDAKWGALYGCESFVLPSHQENFGIAVVEAMACGKPVLISNQINIYDEIEKEGAAIVNEDTLDGTFATLKKWLLLDQPEQHVYALNAGNCYEKYYSESKAGQTMLGLLKTNKL